MLLALVATSMLGLSAKLSIAVLVHVTRAFAALDVRMEAKRATSFLISF